MSDSIPEIDPPPIWLENGSCHHPVLEYDAEYLISNPVMWGEVLRAVVLFIISFLIIITNLCFLLSINIHSIRW